MMRAAALILSVALTGCTAAPVKPEPEPATGLTSQQRAQCDAEGGCILITRTALRLLAARIAQQAAEAGAQSCRRGAL